MDWDWDASMFVSISSLILTVAVIATVIFLYVYVFKNVNILNKDVLEMKSKIGSLIRDINYINKQEFDVDVDQQKSINKLMHAR
jgi:hypothetical protein